MNPHTVAAERIHARAVDIAQAIPCFDQLGTSGLFSEQTFV